MYLGFEKDVFKTIADYYGHLKEPLLTFHLFDAFVSVLGKLDITSLLMWIISFSLSGDFR